MEVLYILRLSDLLVPWADHFRQSRFFAAPNHRSHANNTETRSRGQGRGRGLLRRLFARHNGMLCVAVSKELPMSTIYEPRY